MTLAFDSSLQFLTLISEAPLEKYGHAPMTADSSLPGAFPSR
jgi:hypothetical protein